MEYTLFFPLLDKCKKRLHNHEAILFYKIINDQLNINSWINQLRYIHTMEYYCNKKEQTNDTCKKMVNLKKKKENGKS